MLSDFRNGLEIVLGIAVHPWKNYKSEAIRRVRDHILCFVVPSIDRKNFEQMGPENEIFVQSMCKSERSITQ